MCRFVFYHGPPLFLGSLVTQPEHSLIHQSLHSRERAEPLNGDGFGVAWYPESSPEPALFRAITPAWNNANLLEVARVVRSSCILAHVRAATQVRSVSQVNCHPFKHGRYAFMHNGDVGGFLRIRRPLLARLSDEVFQTIAGATDSEHLFALFLQELAAKPGPAGLPELVDAWRRALEVVVELVERHAPGALSFVNCVLTDGRLSVVTRFTTKEGYDGESLHLHRGRRYECEGGVCRMVEPEQNGGAVIVSSEPLSADPGWETVPRNHLVTIDADRSIDLVAL